MKYAIIIPDGAADEPQAELDGRTPLEGARTPAMDAIAAAGVVARACHTPKSLPAGSEVGNMSLLGYDPLAISPAGRRSRPRPRVLSWASRIGPSAVTS
jgi:2,3-bisphosphoglycerate-independent phosphoglycerate mutase